MNKTVTLVGWLDLTQQKGKFIRICDGYGHTQVLVETDELRRTAESVTNNDIVLVSGRVLKRPESNIIRVFKSENIFKKPFIILLLFTGA